MTIHGESHLVQTSGGGRIYLAYPFLQEVEAGMNFEIERGCDKVYKPCDERFDNLANFSGYPAIPWESVYR